MVCAGFMLVQPMTAKADDSVASVQHVQQKQSVSGVVKDATGEPVIGASVVEKGTTNGTITDFDGIFNLDVAPGTTLTISFIGYKTLEVAAVPGKQLNIQMVEDTEVLDEVVVVGYGTMRKKDLTGSVVQINPAKIADTNPTSVQDVLRGTPGLQIGYDASAKGSSASIQLRGQNSLGTSASPLIVLDGMAFNGELSEINPDDIGQIDVLKDASSAAVYGAKAAAGVIIITTKKGKEGKPVINVSSNLAVNSKSAYRDYFDAAGTCVTLKIGIRWLIHTEKVQMVFTVITMLKISLVLLLILKVISTILLIWEQVKLMLGRLIPEHRVLDMLQVKLLWVCGHVVSV